MDIARNGPTGPSRPGDPSRLGIFDDGDGARGGGPMRRRPFAFSRKTPGLTGQSLAAAPGEYRAPEYLEVNDTPATFEMHAPASVRVDSLTHQQYMGLPSHERSDPRSYIWRSSENCYIRVAWVDPPGS